MYDVTARHSQVRTQRWTGVGAIAVTLAPAGERWWVTSLRLHLDAGGAATDFTIIEDNGTAAVHDVLIYTRAMAAVTDIVMALDTPGMFEEGDELDFAYANGGGATWGLEIIYASD